MEKIYFISGLPRSGNTLLASILNQNPEIFATGHSATPEIFHSIKKAESTDAAMNWVDQRSNLTNLYSDLFKSFYKTCNKKYVIERSDWIVPVNYQFIEKYCPNEIRIVVLVRDVLEIITSFIQVCHNHPAFYINQRYNSIPDSLRHKSKIEDLADIIMQRGDYVDAVLAGIKNVVIGGDKTKFKIVEYNDLVSDPIQTLTDIYNFYEIPWYEHDLNNIPQLSGYNDNYIGAPLHTIITDGVYTNPKNIVLPESVKRKYSNMEYWRNV